MADYIIEEGANKEENITVENTETTASTDNLDFANFSTPPIKEEDKTDSKEKDKTEENKTEEGSEENIDTEFTLFGENKEEKAEAVKPKTEGRDYSKFKELLEEDDDINDDDALLERVSKLKGKAKAQEIINTANERFQNDEQVKSWISWIEADDDVLLEAVYVAENYTKEDAKAMIADLKDENPAKYRAEVNKIKNNLAGAIENKKREIQSEVQEAAKTLKELSPKDIDSKFLAKAIESASKMTEFAGLKLGVEGKEKEKFLLPLKTAIESGELIKKLKSDPDLLAGFAFYATYKEQIKAALAKKTMTKKNFVDTLDKAPHSSGKAKPFANANAIDTGDFNPIGWK